MYNQIIINIFKELQLYWEIKEDIHRANAYRNAISSLESYSNSILNINDVPDLPGLGKRSIEKIKMIINGATLRDFIPHDDLKIMQAYSELIKIKDVGRTQAIKWINNFKVYSLKDLKTKVNKGKIKLTDGQKIGVKYYRDLNSPIPRSEIIKLDKIVQKTVKKLDIDLDAYILGSYRRHKPFSNDLDLLLTSSRIPTAKHLYSADSMINSFVGQLSKFGVQQICIKTGKSVSKKGRKSINLEYLWKYSNYWRKVDLKFFAYESKIPAILYFTGSRNFNKRIRERLKQIGYMLNQYGLYKKKLKTHRTGKKGGIKYIPVPVKSEEDIFMIAKMKYIPPEKRI